MSTDATYFEAETLIVERLKVRVPEVRAVLTAAALDDILEERQIVPALHVIFAGANPQPHRDGSRIDLVESWYIVVAVRNPANQRSGEAARQDAGILLGKVARALELWRPGPGFGVMKLSSALPPLFSPGGFLYAPLQYQLASGFELDFDLHEHMKEPILPSSVTTETLKAPTLGRNDDCPC